MKFLALKSVDDIVYWKRVFGNSDLLAVQCDIDMLFEWVSRNGLRLNTSKSKCLVISRKRNPPTPTIKVDGAALEQVSSFRYLGITIDSNLSWSHHVATICSRARKLLGFLYRNFKLADRKCITHLYKMLVRPTLEYSDCVWDPHQAYNIQKLERVQNFAARLATGHWKECPEVLQHETGWPTLVQRRVFHKLCLVRRIITGGSLIPDSSFTPHVAPHLRHLNSCPLRQPFASTNYHRTSFFVGSVPFWNALPDNIVSLVSNLAFKRHLKQFMVV